MMGREKIMRNADTVNLLKECDAGTKMGVTSIDEVLPTVKSPGLKTMLSNCRENHKKLGCEARGLLEQHNAEGKDPSPIAEGMSWFKTNVKLAVDAGDDTVADLMIDGCNTGVKSLNRYLNQYQDADEQAKSVVRRLAEVEDRLAKDIRPYL